MTSRERGEADLALVERILLLLNEAQFSATYKLAVLAAIMDLCLEHRSDAGAPEVLTTRQLAHKVIELYWPQTAPYADLQPPALLKQGGADLVIVRAIGEFRARLASDPQCPLERARRQDQRGFDGLVRKVEWTLIHMPLPKLQRIGTSNEPFLYEISWDDSIERKKRASGVAGYLRTGLGFDNTVRLRPGVAESLTRLHGLLRPLIQRKWSQMVAKFNDLPVSRLDDFLFGEDRVSLVLVREPLLDLQEGRCFYCLDPLRGAPHVDHFVPWSRHPDNGIDNLVVAHDRCNGAKSDDLACAEHVTRWASRSQADSAISAELARIATTLPWPRDAGRTRSVARSIYLGLPPGLPLWRSGRQDFEPADLAVLRTALSGPP